MNNLIIGTPQSDNCLGCKHAILIHKEFAIVCRADVTKRTWQPKCIYRKDSEEDVMTKEEFQKLVLNELGYFDRPVVKPNKKKLP